MLDKYAIQIDYFDADRTVKTFTMRSASIEWVELRVRQTIRHDYPKGKLFLDLADELQEGVDEGCYGIRLEGYCIGQVSINETDRD